MRWVDEQYKGGLLRLADMDVNIGKPVDDVLRLKHPNPISLAMGKFSLFSAIPSLIYLDITSDIFKRVSKMMHGAAGPIFIDAVAW